MLDSAPGEKLRQVLAFVDRARANEHGAAFFMLHSDVFDDGLPLVVGRAEDHRGQLFADGWPVCRDGDDAGSIYLAQLAGARRGGARHAGEPFVAEEEILHGDAGSLVRGEGDLYTFFGFDGLVDAGPPLAAFAEAAGEFVDDDNLAIADHIVLVQKHLAPNFDRALD